MRLVAFGVGYVGLVSGTGLAELGHDVLCVDIDPERIRQLEDGIIPIYEPGLGDLVRRNVRNGRLHFATDVSPPFDSADAYFVAVGTPPGPDGAADVSAVFTVANRIVQIAKKPALVVVKSTVPVGTCDAVQARIDKAASLALEVVSNPEFLKEGTAVDDFFKPDRIVLGARSEEAREMLRALYAPLQLSGERVVVTDPRSSELTKYAANTMLAMRVSFMNELARLCHTTGHGVPMRLAEATHLANEEQADFLAHLVEKAVGPLKDKTVALWGLAFKPETDDIRESPSIKLTGALLARGASVVGHDPEAGRNFAKAMASHGARVKVTDRDYDALDQAHALVLLTEWRSYRAPNFAEIRKRLRDADDGGPPVVVDGRNVWRPSEVMRAGLRYQGIGVPATTAPPPSLR